MGKCLGLGDEGKESGSMPSVAPESAQASLSLIVLDEGEGEEGRRCKLLFGKCASGGGGGGWCVPDGSGLRGQAVGRGGMPRGCNNETAPTVGYFTRPLPGSGIG